MLDWLVALGVNLWFEWLLAEKGRDKVPEGIGNCA